MKKGNFKKRDTKFVEKTGQCLENRTGERQRDGEQKVIGGETNGTVRAGRSYYPFAKRSKVGERLINQNEAIKKGLIRVFQLTRRPQSAQNI